MNETLMEIVAEMRAQAATKFPQWSQTILWADRIERAAQGGEWSFEFYGDPKYLDEWRADGLDIVEVRNTVPVWVLNLGMENVWIWLQDLFYFRWWPR